MVVYLTSTIALVTFGTSVVGIFSRWALVPNQTASAFVGLESSPFPMNQRNMMSATLPCRLCYSIVNGRIYDVLTSG